MCAPASCARLVSRLPWGVAAEDVQEIRGELGVLQPEMLPDRLVARARLAEPLEHEPAVKEQVQLLAQGARKAGDAERQPHLQLGRGCGEDPLLDLAVQPAEVVPDLDRVGDPVFVSEVLAVRRVEAGVGDREL